MQEVNSKNIHKTLFKKTDKYDYYVHLKNHATIRTRISWKKLKQSDYTTTGPYLISGKHIKNNSINWNECDHISYDDFNKSPEIILEENDIIFTKDGNLGNPTIIKYLKDDSTINSTMMLIRLDESVNPDYFFQIIQSEIFEHFIKQYKTGSGVPHLLLRDVKNFKFPLPKISVQNKIVKLLSSLDNKLRLLKEKYDIYVKLRDYYMQILILAYNKTKPIKHFSEDTSQWKKAKLGDIGDIITGSTPSTYNKNNYDKNGILWITPRDYNNNKYITDSNKKISTHALDKCKLIPKESIFITCIGTIGKVAVNKENCCCNQQINAIVPSDKFDTNYVYYYMLKNSSRLEYYSNQSVTPIINKNDFKNFNIGYPMLDVQIKIGKFLSIIDEKINFCKKNIETLSESKKNITRKLILI